MSRVDINTKDFFSQLDDDTIKSAKKKDKKDKKSKKVNKNNPFGYDFDPNDFKKKKNKDKKTRRSCVMKTLRKRIRIKKRNIRNLIKMKIRLLEIVRFLRKY